MVNMAPLSADDALFYTFFIIGPLGLIVNSLLLAITFRKKSIREREYTIFIQNRALMDLAICLQFLLVQPWVMDCSSINPVWCTITAGLFISTFYAMIMSESALAMNRYISICRPHLYQRVYRKRYVYLMCFAVWLLGALIGIVNGFAGALGRSPGSFCSVIVEWSSVLVILAFNYPITSGTYVIIFYCYWKIHRFLKDHQKNALTNGERTRLQEDKFILRYIKYLALIPVLSELPSAISMIVHVYDPSLVPHFAIFGTNLIFMLCPVLEPILTLYIVRPIRKELLDMTKRLKKTSAVMPTPMAQLHVVPMRSIS